METVVLPYVPELISGNRFDFPAGRFAEAGISSARPESGPSVPEASVRMAWNDAGLFGIFRVRERFVRAVPRGFNGPVHLDSCVEFFVSPTGGGRYFNFEWNAGGSFFAGFVTDCARTPGGGVRGLEPLGPEEAREVVNRPSLPSSCELSDPFGVEWTLAFMVPFRVMRAFEDFPDPRPGAEWRCNFYKCGDGLPEPHWTSWNPLSARNFHLPDCFGTMRFGGR